MLTRRAKAYSSSCSQTVSLSSHFVAVHSWSGRCSRRSQKSIKTHYFRSSIFFKVIDVDTTEKLVTIVLVVIGRMSMPICNRFHERLANNGKTTTFTRYCSLMLSCAGFLEPRKWKLEPSKSSFNAENFIPSFSMSISIDFGTIRS